VAVVIVLPTVVGENGCKQQLAGFYFFIDMRIPKFMKAPFVRAILGHRV
jgi:hypothetical protein